MEPLAGYRLRAATPDDLHGVAAVLAADDLDDAGVVVLDTGFVRDEWERADFDLATDAWVVTDAVGTVVGYGQITRDEEDVVESWGVVHPEHRALGIGTALLDRITDRAPLMLPGVRPLRFRHAVNAADTAAAAMLTARGLRPVRHFWHMEIELTGPSRPEPGRVPIGVAIDPIRAPDDLPAVHAVLDEAFADHWDHRPEPFERWVEDLTQGPSYDPTLWLLARLDGRPVGALTAVVLGDRGWISLLGVLAPFRGRGIAAALLRHAFATLRARGIERVLLAVDAENPTGATALYERAGMGVVKRWDLWERVLDGPIARGPAG